jgi:hypothetical protein
MKSDKITLMMNLKSLFLVGSTLLFSQLIGSQTKNEKEERVELKTFPEKAIKVLETLPEDCKRLRFYKETDGSKQSFEAKFKYKKQRYSIEFNSSGTIEDIEVGLKPKDIENAVASEIRAYFKTTYKRSKLIKIQKQYVFNPVLNPIDFLRDVLAKRSRMDINYEIIAEVKSDSKRNIREYTFDSSGSFLNYKIIHPGSYEHALYH